jgi:hypothetical protein
MTHKITRTALKLSRLNFRNILTTIVDWVMIKLILIPRDVGTLSRSQNLFMVSV